MQEKPYTHPSLLGTNGSLWKGNDGEFWRCHTWFKGLDEARYELLNLRDYAIKMELTPEAMLNKIENNQLTREY